MEMQLSDILQLKLLRISPGQSELTEGFNMDTF